VWGEVWYCVDFVDDDVVGVGEEYVDVC